MRKRTTHIRIRPEDSKIWKEYCNILGERSPDLFGKILKSPEIKMNERILNELAKKQTNWMRRMEK